MKPIRPALAACVALAAASCTTEPTQGTTNVPEKLPLPGEVVLVGEEASGEQVAQVLANEGFVVRKTLTGRESGIEAFCTGNADGLSVGTQLSDSERAHCKDLGGDFSAMSGNGGTMLLYVSYPIADAFAERSTVF